jgi:tryptophan synthase alpha chain
MKKNRINALFDSGRKNLLSVYYTAGYPLLDSTVPLAIALSEAGADIIEIGIPYSDPVADGPTIQESNKIALDNGMRLSLVIKQVGEIRAQVDIPIILMGYVNPVMQYGIEKFAADIAAAGVDGVILPDLPMDAYLADYREVFESANVRNTFLISPTTSTERIARIDSVTNGFIYAVAASSITGAKGSFTEEQLAYFARLKGMSLRNPFLIGFGISNQESFAQACAYGAGAIVGSAFINALKDSDNVERDAAAFVRKIKDTVSLPQ